MAVSRLPESDQQHLDSPDDRELREVRAIVRMLAPAAAALPDEVSFLDGGAVDSLTFLSILREVEGRCGVSLSSDGVLLADLSSVTQIANHVVRCRAAALER